MTRKCRACGEQITLTNSHHDFEEPPSTKIICNIHGVITGEIKN